MRRSGNREAFSVQRSAVSSWGRLAPAGLFLLTNALIAAQVPASTEMHIRLTGRLSCSDSKAGAAVNAVLIAPVVEDGQIVLPPGAQLTGEVKAAQAAAADRTKAPTLEPVFGVIIGVPASKTYTSQIDRGIEKMSGNDKFSGLAGILQAAKSALVADADPDITYDAGVEMTVKTTAALHVARRSAGVVSEVQPIPGDSLLPGMVSRMPLRALTTERIPSDITNIVFIGFQEQLASAFESAGWSTAARLDGQSKFRTARAMIEQRGYKEAPVSVLLIDRRPPDLVYQKQNDTFDARHHLRIWRRPGSFEGRPIWICAATHDIGISYADREGTFIHRIDSNVDDERAKVTNDLIFARKTANLALVGREGFPADAVNATGDALHTDGQVAIVVLR